MKDNNSNAERSTMQDSYMSYESALYLRGCFSPTIYRTEYASLNGHKDLDDVVYHQIPKSHFFGFKEDDSEMIAEPEKALLDIIYRESQRDNHLNYLCEVFEEVEWEELSIQKIDKYSKRMGFNWKEYLPKEVGPRYPELAEIIKKCA